jgi:hypothetical protein
MQRVADNRCKWHIIILEVNSSTICNETVNRHPGLRSLSLRDNHNNYESFLAFAVDLGQIQNISGLAKLWLSTVNYARLEQGEGADRMMSLSSAP